MSSSRDRLAALIEPMLPDAWKRIEAHTVKTIVSLSRPTVYIDYTSITHAGMPEGQLIDGFDIALISDLTDYAKAEDALDSAVRPFVRALDASPDIAWSAANKRAFAETYLGWVVTVQLLTPSTEE
jgi:hypothetical protein